MARNKKVRFVIDIFVPENVKIEAIQKAEISRQAAEYIVGTQLSKLKIKSKNHSYNNHTHKDGDCGVCRDDSPYYAAGELPVR